MNEEMKLKALYEEAYNFLKSKVGEPVLKKHLEYYHIFRPSSMNDIFKRMIITLKNKQGYFNFIADVDQMKTILLDFNPKKVFEKYDSEWEKLFMDFRKRFGGSYRMDIHNKRNAWVMYSKGVLSCSKFLSNFKSVSEFDRFVKSFFHDEFTIASLPMLLEREIFGFGFALACDFLKELGYVQYGKPDVHLKDIFLELGVVKSRSDYEVFKKIVKIALVVGQDPVIVDKIFWLIGSGKFHETGMNIGKQKSEFIRYVKNKLNP